MPADSLVSSGMINKNLEVQSVPLDSIHEDPANARKHDPKNLTAIRASLLQFGQVEPLIVQKDSGKVIGGNGRLTVLRELGEETAQVVYVEVNDVQAAALGIALNRSAELADWDQEALARTLDALKNELPDLPVAELSFDDLINSIAPAADVEIPEEPEAPEDFKEYDEDIPTEFCCPKCAYRWSGKPA